MEGMAIKSSGNFTYILSLGIGLLTMQYYSLRG
jgi:hypothetical protein